MNRKEFDSLSIELQINYINTQLDEGKSLNMILKEIGIPKSTFRDRATRYGYKLDLEKRQYFLITNVINHEEQNKSNTIANNEEHRIINTKESNESMCKSITNVNNNYNSIEKVISEMQQQLNEVYNWYLKEKNIIEKEELKITKFKGEAENRTYKIYPDVLKAFNKFCKEHKQYKVQDIISQAILEFIKKYE